MCSTTKVHPFEAAGLGKAPFKLLGIEHQEIRYGERVIGSVGGCAITTKPGGTCAFCGQYIIAMFNIESADGNRFHVGCDCVRKVDAKLRIDVDKAKKEHKKERDTDRIAEAVANLPNAWSLRSQKHPSPYQAEQGKSLHDYCRWLLQNAGTSGKLRAARMVEAAIAQRVEM